MGGASSFYAMLAIAGFLSSIWIAGRISMLIGVSSIVLEIGVGIVLGPDALKLIPDELTGCSFKQVTDCDTNEALERVAFKTGDDMVCDLQAYLDKGKYAPKGEPWFQGFFGDSEHVTISGHKYILNGSESNRRLAGGSAKGKTKYKDYTTCLKEKCVYEVNMECATRPNIFTIVGHIGVALMIFESGMHFDFEQAKKVGPWACAIAVLGTFLPIIAGAAVTMAFGFDFNEGLAVGVSLAPTSVGIALKLLHEARALNLYFGQAVMTAAFVDDVLSLIIFSVLFSLGDDMTFMTFLPLICGCVFMLVAIVAAVTVWPKIIVFVMSKFEGSRPGSKLSRQDEVMWILMFVVLLAYGMITHLCGTHLWGCFIAGMSFATQPEAHHVWVRQVKRLTVWMIRIFFASTLAWAIPISDLFSPTALWKGSLMGIGPCILTKVLCAPFMGDARWVIGWAMVGRAEFAYFIAIMAQSEGMLGNELFAILVWSLVYATVFAPLVFRYVLKKYMLKIADPTQTQATQATSTGEASEAMSEQESQDQLEDEQQWAIQARAYSDPAMLVHQHLPDLVAEKKAKERRAKERAAARNEQLLQAQEAEIEGLKAKIAELEGIPKIKEDPGEMSV